MIPNDYDYLLFDLRHLSYHLDHPNSSLFDLMWMMKESG